MNYEKIKERNKKLSGHEEQEILINRLSDCISGFSKMHTSTIETYVKDALSDALEKRSLNFKDIKTRTKEEKSGFVKDIVLYSVKKATLVGSVDEIVAACNSVYEEWKQQYRPEEV